MNIDLAADVADLRSMIDQAVEKYAGKHANPKTAAAYPPVSRIDLNFWLGDGGPSSPFIMLQFDTKPGSEPDGDPTHPEFATLKRPKWRAPILATFDDKPASAKLLNGKSCEITENNVDKIIGEFLVAVLKMAKSSGAWKKLPKLARCEMGVEGGGGSFAWPHYEERGRDNLA
jgi:hypothetical protein